MATPTLPQNIEPERVLEGASIDDDLQQLRLVWL